MSYKNNNNSSSWRIVAIVFIAIALLVVASFCPWSKWSNGAIKDFNLFGDILSQNIDADSISDCGVEGVDSLLIEAMKSDTREIDSLEVDDSGAPIIAVQPSRDGDMVIIEDYTSDGSGLKNLRSALNAQNGVTRIAVIGDSYIEGDIFTQNLREMLQDEYGGAGVGYINMYTEFPGFRRSVKQGGDGWKEFSANNKSERSYTGISQHYFKPKGNATSTYKGVTALRHLDNWTRSQFLFISPENTTIKVKTSGEWKEHQITGSKSVQSIIVDEPTDRFEISTSSPSVIALGVWLEGDSGISVDCMSSRGFSGLTLNNVSVDLAAEMSKIIDYDLIILEFGINAMSPKQKNFNTYSKKMVEVVGHVRQCYPQADIILMGIGDRGEKQNGEVHSMESVPYMIAAQREAARKAHCLFWDTREAMGGDDAIVAWTRQGYANKDYIHLSHKGGKELAKPLFNAIQHNLKK